MKIGFALLAWGAVSLSPVLSGVAATPRRYGFIEKMIPKFLEPPPPPSAVVP
jgi:hypothetical protein